MEHLPTPSRNNSENCKEVRDVKQKRQYYVNGIIMMANNLRNNPTMESLIDLSELVDTLSENLGVSKKALEKEKAIKRKTDGSFSRCLTREEQPTQNHQE